MEDKFKNEEVPQRPNEDFAEESDEPKEKLEEDMEKGEREEDVYSKAGREKLEEDDEIEPAEAGFMEGASGKGTQAICETCRKPLDTDDKNIIEKEINGQVKWFCNEECFEKYQA